MANINIVQGDISKFQADALVNSANNHLWMGSGVAGALKRAGGPVIEQEAIAKGPVPVGSAVATSAGLLPARYVIHGAVMGQDLRTDPETVERTTTACLELALELGIRSIAMPAFGCGVGGMGYRDTAEAMKRSINSLDDGSLDDLEISIVLFGIDAYRVFQGAFSGRLP